MEWNEREPLPELELDDLLNSWQIAVPSERLRAAAFPKAGGVHGLRLKAWAAMAACLLAAFAAGWFWNRTKNPAKVENPGPIAFADADAPAFVPIPYTVPLSRDESATVVRMNLSVAELLADGFRLPASDPAETAPAEVMVAEDGRAVAVRLVKR